LERVPDDGPILLQDCNELPSLTLYQFITDDDWRGSVVVEEGILQTNRQWLQLWKRRLWCLLLT
jgi:hypothetical protein